MRNIRDKILKFKKVNGVIKKEWQNFFEAVSIVRNRGAHSNQKLTKNERAKLENGGLEEALNNQYNTLTIGLGEQQLILQKFIEFISVYCK